jgi:hypothetical protein
MLKEMPFVLAASTTSSQNMEVEMFRYPTTTIRVPLRSQTFLPAELSTDNRIIEDAAQETNSAAILCFINCSEWLVTDR